MATGGIKPEPDTGKYPKYEEKLLAALTLLGLEPTIKSPEDVVDLVKAFSKAKEDPHKEAAKTTQHYPKFSTFFGDEGKNDVSWASFKYEVESQLAEKNYSEAQILKGIRRSLKGSAYDKLRILGIGALLAEILAKLESDFGTVESKESVRRKFYSCTQKDNKNVESFACRLEDLYEKPVRLGAIKRTNRYILKDGFHSGLNNELQHLTVYQKDRYSNYDVFKRELRKIEADIRPQEQPETKKASKAAVQHEKTQMSEIKQLLKQLNERIDTIEKDKQQQQQPYFYPRDQGFRGAFRGSFGGRSRGSGNGLAAPPPRGRGEYRP